MIYVSLSTVSSVIVCKAHLDIYKDKCRRYIKSMYLFFYLFVCLFIILKQSDNFIFFMIPDVLWNINIFLKHICKFKYYHGSW